MEGEGVERCTFVKADYNLRVDTWQWCTRYVAVGVAVHFVYSLGVQTAYQSCLAYDSSALLPAQASWLTAGQGFPAVLRTIASSCSVRMFVGCLDPRARLEQSMAWGRVLLCCAGDM